MIRMRTYGFENYLKIKKFDGQQQESISTLVKGQSKYYESNMNIYNPILQIISYMAKWKEMNCIRTTFTTIYTKITGRRRHSAADVEIFWI